jgi:hypothetical protein
MGSSNSIEADEQAPGWITEDGPALSDVDDLAIQEKYIRMVRLARRLGLREAERKAWWLLRWSSSAVEDKDTTEARIRFLEDFYGTGAILGFLPYAASAELARENPGKVVMTLDDTVPGNVVMVLFADDRRNYVRMHNVNPHSEKIRSWARIHDLPPALLSRDVVILELPQESEITIVANSL